MKITILRFLYAAAFLLLVGVEVVIALFVHDAFIRPYVGDMLVVIVLYCLIRVIIPKKCKLLPLYVFIFAAGVEILQLFHIVELLGVQNITFLRVLIGSVFDIKDIGCYAVGCVLLAIFEMVKNRKTGDKRNETLHE